MLDFNRKKAFSCTYLLPPDKQLVELVYTGDLPIGGLIFTEQPEEAVFDLIRQMEAKATLQLKRGPGRPAKSL